MPETQPATRIHAVLWALLLSTPLLVVAALQWHSPPAAELESQRSLLESLIKSYAIFSAPLWIWSAIASVLHTSDKTLLGGLAGANALLVFAGAIVLQSQAPEAANGWFVYLLGSPVAIALGAVSAQLLTKRTNAA